MHNLKDEYLSRWFKIKPTAEMGKTIIIWRSIISLFSNCSSSSKVNSTLALTSFNFPVKGIIENKKIFDAHIRAFSAFGGEETQTVADLIDHLSACILLVKLRKEFETIRTLYEQQEANRTEGQPTFLNVTKISTA